MTLADVLNDHTLPLGERFRALVDAQLGQEEIDINVDVIFKKDIVPRVQMQYSYIPTQAQVVADAVAQSMNHFNAEDDLDAIGDLLAIGIPGQLGSYFVHAQENSEDRLQFIAAYSQALGAQDISGHPLTSKGGVALSTFSETYVRARGLFKIPHDDLILAAWRELVEKTDDTLLMSDDDVSVLRQDLIKTADEFDLSVSSGMKDIFMEHFGNGELVQKHAQEIRYEQQASQRYRLTAYHLVSERINSILQGGDGDEFFYRAFGRITDVTEFVDRNHANLENAMRERKYDNILPKARHSKEDVDAYVREFARYALSDERIQQSSNISSKFLNSKNKINSPLEDPRFVRGVLFALADHGYIKINIDDFTDLPTGLKSEEIMALSDVTFSFTPTEKGATYTSAKA